MKTYVSSKKYSNEIHTSDSWKRLWAKLTDVSFGDTCKLQPIAKVIGGGLSANWLKFYTELVTLVMQPEQKVNDLAK